MLDVHGVAVSGPGFPASIWRLYMTSVIGKRKDVPFRVVASTPDFKSWQGHWQYWGSPVAATTTATTTSRAPRTTTRATTTDETTTVATTTGTETTTTEPVTTTVPAGTSPVTTTP